MMDFTRHGVQVVSATTSHPFCDLLAAKGALSVLLFSVFPDACRIAVGSRAVLPWSRPVTVSRRRTRMSAASWRMRAWCSRPLPGCVRLAAARS